MNSVPQVVDNIKSLRALRATSPGVADTGPDQGLTAMSVLPDANAALTAWRRSQTEPATK